MSRLWREQLQIGLCPDRLIVVGRQRGLRPRLTKKEIIAVSSSREAPDWRAAINALPAALAPQARGKTEVTVILSNHFVRYALLAWNATLKTQDEWLALARHRLASVHGAAVEGWALRACETAPRGPRLVAAADQALLDALAERIAAGGATLVSVQPYFMAAFNRIRRAIGKESCWLVNEEPGRLTLALIERGIWRAIRSRGVDDRWPAALAEILDRESAAQGLDQPCTRVVIHAQEALDAGVHGAYHVRDLTLPAGLPSSDRQLAMALG